MAREGNRRVVVTGMGAVSAAGIGIEPLWQAAQTGESAIGPVQLSREVNNRVKIAAQVRNFDPSRYIAKNVATYCDPFSQFAIVAADEAIKQAGLENAGALGQSTGVVLGAGIGGIATVDAAHFGFTTEAARIDPLAIPKAMPSSAASHVSIRYGCNGPTFAVSSACASATQAIGIGFQLVRSGIAERVIVGGSDASITPVTFRSWEALRVLTPDFCRPFSKGRNGMVLGEGAAIFVLETEQSARSRDVTPIAEVLGYGTSADGVDMLRPDPAGAIAAIAGALADASLSPDTIDYINAHGTGTVLNDIVEARAINAVFGMHAPRIPVSSTKPIHGHALGAAGALEFAISVKALVEGIVPPTINWVEKDEECDLDLVPNKPRRANLRTVMSNSFAFGGINAVVIAGRPS